MLAVSLEAKRWHQCWNDHALHLLVYRHNLLAHKRTKSGDIWVDGSVSLPKPPIVQAKPVLLPRADLPSSRYAAVLVVFVSNNLGNGRP